jgi:serine phosphatase RsbU (regulator of sigma subunit)/anti-sigma regulatory factor (Ser/Thr protein kinase)/uncharacterized protein YigA (DUF484 family)
MQQVAGSKDGALTTVAEMVLGAEADVVPRARRFAASALPHSSEDLVSDAELVVTELVTNALLHGAPPFVLRVEERSGRVRVEVEDCGKHLPVRPRSDANAMTGRGLKLVATLAISWGVERSDVNGKVVWAELAEGTGEGQPSAAYDVDVDALLDSWHDDLEAADGLYEVRLGVISTDLLLGAKAHIDNVVRELTLAAAGDPSGLARQTPFARLIETVTHSVAGARADIKRQALAAAARGDRDTELVLRLPAAAADAGVEYLNALDEADRYARAARLLTLETPPVHRVFRQWYVRSMIDSIRAQSAGEPAPPVRRFEDALADEVTALSSLREGWERLQMLQAVTAELTVASTVEDIASTVAQRVREFLGALTVQVFVVDEANRVLRSIASSGDVGMRRDEFAVMSLDSELPGAMVARTGEPLLLRSTAALSQQFPALADIYPSERSLHVTPLSVGDHRMGVLSITLPAGSDFAEGAQVEFIRALADALAQALERALSMQRASVANAELATVNERLSFLADASVALSGSLDYQETVDAVTRLMVPRLADWCVVQVLANDTLQTAGLLHFDPAKVRWAESMAGRYPTRMDSETGGPQVIRSGVSEIYPEIPSELLEAGAIDAEHLDLINKLGMSSAMVVPLSGRTGSFGALTLIYAESGRRYSDADLTFAEDVARRAALAIETARVFHEQSGRLADVTRVADAAQHAILSPPPAQLGRISLAARYVSAAAEALVGGDLYEVVRRADGVRLIIGDVRGKGLTAVRTATVVLGEFRAAAAGVDDLVESARQIDQRLRPYLGEEDFVTAVLADLKDDGRLTVATCGHPPALLATAGGLVELTSEPSLPLGLGADPVPITRQLSPGDRLLLYTDGVIEARDSQRRFVDLERLAAPVRDGGLEDALDQMLAALHDVVGVELGDDLALLLAEFSA